MLHPARVSNPTVDRFSFGDFTLDPLRRHVCRRDGTPLVLTPRLFNALQMFVEHPGELLDKNHMLAVLWPGLVVEENGLSQVISALRRALGDEGPVKRYIQTEPRRGFRFVAEVAAFQKSHGVASGPTLAVLPFVSLACDARDELLEVGMADSLIARLSAVPGLVVRSVGSVRRYAGIDRDPLKVASALEVAWVIDGSLQRRGAHLRVTARLLGAPEGAAAWSGSFDARDDGVFDVQDAIADRVAEALSLQLRRSSAVASERPADGGTRNVEAYRHYLAGRGNVQVVRGDELRQSVAAFERAIEIDPSYALARVGKAEARRRMVYGADSAPTEVFDASRTWVLQALEVAPQLAEAHCELACILYWYDYSWSEAAHEFRQALALKPSLASAHFNLGFLLASLGRIEEALNHVRTSCELDPMGLVYNAHYACLLAQVGERAAGHALLKWVLEVAPEYWLPFLILGRLCLLDGDLDAATAAARRAHELCGGQSTQPTAMLGAFCARSGRCDEARSILTSLEQRARERFVPPSSLAAVFAALGEHGRALDHLERGVEVHDTRLVYLKDDWRWEPLRSNARYRALLHRMKLDGYGPGMYGT